MGSVVGRLVGVLVAAVAFVGCSAASPAQLGPRTVDLTIQSPAVGSAVAVRLLLPTRYAVEPTRTWPVLYRLHGCCDPNESWVEQTDIGELTRDDGVIVAMPFAGTWPHWERELHRAWPILAQALGV